MNKSNFLQPEIKINFLQSKNLFFSYMYILVTLWEKYTHSFKTVTHLLCYQKSVVLRFRM